jgi:Spy/CpxP family protein refolding chaperone
MLKRLFAPALAATLFLGACETATTAPSTPTADQVNDDYALLMFGESGAALSGTMGTDAQSFDGRHAHPSLPEEIALTEEQKAEIQALKDAFKADHAEEIAALKAIFQSARAARLAGASREEVHAILLTGRDIARELRPDVVALWTAIWNVLTDEQKAWLLEHRARRFPPPIAEG